MASNKSVKKPVVTSKGKLSDYPAAIKVSTGKIVVNHGDKQKAVDKSRADKPKFIVDKIKNADKPRTLSELVSLLKENKDKTIQEIVYLIKSIDRSINIRYHSDKDTGNTRLLLSAMRHMSYPTELNSHCNGVIIQYPSMKVLASPEKTIYYNYDQKELESNFDQYDIYKVIDGTICTLYYFDDKWCIATGKGMDVSNYNARTLKKTYGEILDECLVNYPDFSYDKLDKEKSYTIGFNHPDLHYLSNKKVWVVKICNIDDLTCCDCDNIGLDIQEKCIDNMEVINLNNMLSILRYVDKQAKINVDINDVHYGYIFRSKNNGKDYVVESNLLREIRMNYYNLPKVHGKVDPFITNASIYSALRIYLNDYKVLRELFSCFKEDYDKFRDDIYMIADDIMQKSELDVSKRLIKMEPVLRKIKNKKNLVKTLHDMKFLDELYTHYV